MRPYTCPADGRTRQPADVGWPAPVACTDYLGVAGTSSPRQHGVLFLDARVRLADVTDGLSNTLLVGERPPSADFVLGWWYAGWGQAQDGSAEMLLGVRERNYGSNGPNCPLGPYHFKPGRDADQCDAFHFWSHHPGGPISCTPTARLRSSATPPTQPCPLLPPGLAGKQRRPTDRGQGCGQLRWPITPAFLA